MHLYAGVVASRISSAHKANKWCVHCFVRPRLFPGFLYSKNSLGTDRLRGVSFRAVSPMWQVPSVSHAVLLVGKHTPTADVLHREVNTDGCGRGGDRQQAVRADGTPPSPSQQNENVEQEGRKINWRASAAPASTSAAAATGRETLLGGGVQGTAIAPRVHLHRP